MASYVSETSLNVTLLQYQGVLERALFAMVVTLPSSVFLFINCVMFFTLRSRPVFRETSRYVFLFNLLCADTIQLVHTEVMYFLAFFKIRFTYPVCGFLIMLLEITNEISPLTLIAMSLERYVAICFPLRHPNIATLQNTLMAIVCIWMFNFLNVMMRVILLLEFPFKILPTLQMADFCSGIAISIGPRSNLYDTVYTCVLFASAAVVIAASFVGVMFAAKSASADNASARKAYKTVLLQLFQLGLSLSATMYSPALMELAKKVSRITFVRIINIFYVLMVILPRCLSSLIYGLRDQSIRPVLLQNLCCGTNIFNHKINSHM